MSTMSAAWVGSKEQSPLRLFPSKQTEVESRAGCQCREKRVRLQVKEKLAPGPWEGVPPG